MIICNVSVLFLELKHSSDRTTYSVLVFLSSLLYFLIIYSSILSLFYSFLPFHNVSSSFLPYYSMLFYFILPGEGRPPSSYSVGEGNGEYRTLFLQTCLVAYARCNQHNIKMPSHLISFSTPLLYYIILSPLSPLIPPHILFPVISPHLISSYFPFSLIPPPLMWSILSALSQSLSFPVPSFPNPFSVSSLLLFRVEVYRAPTQAETLDIQRGTVKQHTHTPQKPYFIYYTAEYSTAPYHAAYHRITQHIIS